MPYIKACGITTLRDGLAACAAGFSALGFVFAPSPRRVGPDRARDICARLPSSVLRVGVFVGEEEAEMRRIARFCSLDLVQLHGKFTAESVRSLGERAIPCLRPRRPQDLEIMEEWRGAFAVLIDTWHEDREGGTGLAGDWGLASVAAGKARIILAGGLNPYNVRAAVSAVKPFGVDVSSGVEKRPGHKDPSLLEAFAAAARDALGAGYTRASSAGRKGCPVW